ncbi:hypothetical protein BM536_032045 [Streptomyces phaeoluteigriseus]|uniref:Uncharacterized protein n=1 Tax=Streptomyces phaeoluteigriseus TaxID=114686 RepID=A0A1V6MKE3_9ACTN|nr:hypothetical protein [Streptomyces phaeoluteigriseus]OQD52742.1 hypothetical protein BM536_032045 [Streptomyces phaeoluteigriseus]
MPDRTVSVHVLRTYRLEVEEPDWCVDPHEHAQHRSDITHYGPEHRLTFNGAALFRVMLAQTPMARKASRDTRAYIEHTNFTATLDAAGLYDLAAALDSAADQLRDFADQHEAFLAGGGQ